MNLRQVAHALLKMRGQNVSLVALRTMTDAQVCAIADLPLLSTINKCARRGGEGRTGNARPILFQGYRSKYHDEIPHVHMKHSKASKDLKYMKQKKEIVLKGKKVNIQFDFGFDHPFVLPFTNTQGHWTREDIVLELVHAYSKFYNKKSTYKPWCKLSYVCVNQLYKDPTNSYYSLDVDIVD